MQPKVTNVHSPYSFEYGEIYKENYSKQSNKGGNGLNVKQRTSTMGNQAQLAPIGTAAQINILTTMYGDKWDNYRCHYINQGMGQRPKTRKKSRGPIMHKTAVGWNKQQANNPNNPNGQNSNIGNNRRKSSKSPIGMQTHNGSHVNKDSSTKHISTNITAQTGGNLQQKPSIQKKKTWGHSNLKNINNQSTVSGGSSPPLPPNSFLPQIEQNRILEFEERGRREGLGTGGSRNYGKYTRQGNPAKNYRSKERGTMEEFEDMVGIKYGINPRGGEHSLDARIHLKKEYQNNMNLMFYNFNNVEGGDGQRPPTSGEGGAMGLSEQDTGSLYVTKKPPSSNSTDQGQSSFTTYIDEVGQKESTIQPPQLLGGAGFNRSMFMFKTSTTFFKNSLQEIPEDIGGRNWRNNFAHGNRFNRQETEASAGRKKFLSVSPERLGPANIPGFIEQHNFNDLKKFECRGKQHLKPQKKKSPPPLTPITNNGSYIYYILYLVGRKFAHFMTGLNGVSNTEGTYYDIYIYIYI